MSFVTYLECAGCCSRFSHHELHNLCPECAQPLLVRYDFEQLRSRFKRSDLSGRASDMWQFVWTMSCS